MRRFGFFLSIALIAGSTAQAAQEHYSATLAEPLAQPKEIMVESNLFKCEGTTCVLATTPSNDPDSLRTCRKIMRQVGQLTAFGKDSAPYTADKLAECNKQ